MPEPTPEQMMRLGQAATDAYRNNPPDLDAWARTYDGLAQLCRHARDQLADGRNESAEFVRLARTIAQAADALARDAMLAYACSGAAAHDFMTRASADLARLRDERGEGSADG